MNGDWIANANQTMSGLLNSHESMFLSTGLALWLGLCIIVLTWDGIQMAFSGGGLADVMQLLIDKIFLFCVPLLILRYYLEPSPIFGGLSFTGVITGGPQFFAKQIGNVAFNELSSQCVTFLKEHPFDIVGGVYTLISAFLMYLCMETTRMAMFFVMSWGLVAQTVIILVGPLFVPFLVFEPLAFLFWNWFRSLLQYSFYPLMAAILVHVFATMLLQMWPLISGVAMVPYFVVAIVGILKSQALVSNLFSGSSGGGGGAMALASKFFGR